MTKNKRAFTLIELLVVIAIIAVLMAILMPALRRVKEQGDMVKCMGNLRQWNLIHSMYVQENDGMFYSGTATGGASDGFYWLAQMPAKEQSYIQNPLWFCPKNKGTMYAPDGTNNQNLSIHAAWGVHTDSVFNRDGVAGSYAINGWVLNVPANGAALSEGRTRVDHWRSPQVRGAAQVPLMVEAIRFDVWPQPNQAPAAREEDTWSSTNHMARAVMNRHVGFVNVSMCDFSAQRVGLKELYTLKWHRSFNTAGALDDGRWRHAGPVAPVDTTFPGFLRPQSMNEGRPRKTGPAFTLHDIATIGQAQVCAGGVLAGAGMAGFSKQKRWRMSSPAQGLLRPFAQGARTDG